MKDLLKFDKDEMKVILYDEVECIELIEGSIVEVFFEEDFDKLEQYINKNVVTVEVEKGEFYTNKFYLGLNNGGQAIINIV